MKKLSFLIVLFIISGILVHRSYADEAVRTMEIVVSEGESIAVWNTDIAASGVTSNTITVLVEDGTDYDIVFPEGSGTAAMFFHYQVGIDAWNTADYIKADNSAADGMLLRINVNSGTALLRIESTGNNMSAVPLTPYTDDGELFACLNAEKDQTADFYLPQNCNLSNITLMMCAKIGTEIKRITDTAKNCYELYDFTQESLTVCSYSDGKKAGSFAIPYTSVYAKDGEIYHCAKIIVPKGTYKYNAGSLKTIKGSAFYLIPEFAQCDEAKRTVWDQNVSAGSFDAPVSYSALENKLHDTGNELITGRNTERKLEKLGIAVVNAEGITHSIRDPGDNFSNTDELSQAGQSRRIEAVRMHLTGEIDGNYSVWYRVHSQYYGWLGWAEDGEAAGSIGLTKRAEAIEVNMPSNNIYVTGGTADRDIASIGDVVNITAPVPEGRSFVRWECNNPDISFDKSAPTVSVNILGKRNDILFSAITEPAGYAVTVGSTGEGGDIAAYVSEATAGTEVSVFAFPDSGYTVASVKGYTADGYFDIAPSETGSDRYTFTMPAKDVELSAAFEKIPYSVITGAEYGTLESNRNTATIGETVTLTLAPQNDMCHLGSLSVRGGGENIETTRVNDSTYTFIMPAGDVTATALFVMDYFVSFENWNGEILEYCDLTAGQTPEYSGQTPVREPNEMYTFTFAGWDKPIAPVSGNDPYVKYTATYTAGPRSYPVTFFGADGIVLQSTDVLYGQTPVYSGETPLKATDENYVYTFEKWEPDIAPVTGEAAYTPVFSATPVLHEGKNPFSLEIYEPVTCPFVPEKSGYYRFWTVGDDINPECTVKDGAGNEVMTKKFFIERGNQLSCECIALLEAGTTYCVTAEAWFASGNISLYIRNVDMHTVYLDQNTENGTVEGEEEGVSYTAYSGEIISPFAVPDAGYGLVKMILTDEDGNRVTEDKDGYVMPQSDVFVTATFAPAHKIDYDVDYEITFMSNGAVFTDWSEETESLEDRAAAGVCVEYTIWWDDGSIIDEFGIKTASGDDVPFCCFWQYSDKMDIWFTMPDEPIIITAKAAEANILTLNSGFSDGKSLQYAVKSGVETNIPKCPFTTPDGKIFDGWATTEGGSVIYRQCGAFTSEEDTALYAMWKDKPYSKTTVSDGPDGKICISALHNMPDEVTLVFAAYMNGRLAWTELRRTAESSEAFTVSGNPDKIKVFVFEDLNTLIPLTEAEEISLN